MKTTLCALCLLLLAACSKGSAPQEAAEAKPDNAATRYADTLKKDVQKAEAAAAAANAANQTTQGELQQVP
ncbi:MAG TPA: hypothetical protein DCM05_16460 [Elusimicrobia bacterium]|nr:hypothetical protein [Elusimicrobiota bacterium]